MAPLPEPAPLIFVGALCKRTSLLDELSPLIPRHWLDEPAPPVRSHQPASFILSATCACKAHLRSIGQLLWMRRITSSPLILCMWISMITRSGRCSITFASASCPSLARRMVCPSAAERRGRRRRLPRGAAAQRRLKQPAYRREEHGRGRRPVAATQFRRQRVRRPHGGALLQRLQQRQRRAAVELS